MHMASLASLSMSKCRMILTAAIPLTIHRNNPVVLSNGANAFISILKALEADTLQGNNAAKAVTAAKALAQSADLDAQGLLQRSLTQEGQARVMAWFS